MPLTGECGTGLTALSCGNCRRQKEDQTWALGSMGFTKEECLRSCLVCPAAWEAEGRCPGGIPGAALGPLGLLLGSFSRSMKLLGPLGAPAPEGGSVGQGQAGVMVGPAWITCLDPPALGLCRCVRRAGELLWPGLCPAHRPAHLLLLPDQRCGWQHLELALLPAPHHHRLLLHAQPGAGRALGVRGHAAVCYLCVRRPGRGRMGLDTACVVGEARLGLARDGHSQRPEL